ncbi:MAG: glycosyltransferase family 4 protein [Hungateiclostridium thermocellum]|nr:glycosyltransferase family 4 protein [Acetivibrio thermocellus]
MKIAMIGQKGIPSRAGGIEIHVEELSKRLVRYGCKVVVYCRKAYCDSHDKEYNGITKKYTPYIKSKHLDAITHAFFSTIHALFTGCDVFHYHALGPSVMAILPKIFGKKVVCTVHGLDWQRGKWNRFASKFLKFGEHITAKYTNATINVSKNLVGYYKEKYGKQTYYIPNGVDKPNNMLPPDIIKRKYNLNKNNYLLFLARLVPEKGAHYLIEAFKGLDTDMKLVIAGGSSHSSKYEKELHEMAKDDDRIIFTGFVEGNELSELYSNAYIYILPSDIEGLPISLLEAMSYGNCCLVSDIPENADVIENMGLTFRKANIADLREKIKQLLTMNEQIEEIKQNIQSFVLSKYNWDDAAGNTLKVYKSIVS